MDIAERSWEGSEATTLLTSPALLLAVALLLLNDWVLKAALGNWLTGKLSDFAGLFAFALFWTALLPKRRDAVFALAAAGFLVWKSPLSEAPLAAWNALGILRLGRVLDYTDWLAVLSLLPAYLVAGRYAREAPRWPHRLRRRIAAITSACIALFAFTATSIAPPFHNLPEPEDYVVPATREEVRRGLHDLQLHANSLSSARVAGRAQPLADTLVVYIRQPPERPVGLTIEVREETPGESRMRLLGARAGGPEPRPEAIHRAFRQQVYEPLGEWVARLRAGEH